MPSATQEQRFGRYVVTGELGRGAMGTVYRALDTALEREVAIKALLPNLPPDAMAEVRERFLREAKAAGRLSHPNIVTIYDVGEQDGIAYIAMELLAGRSLQRMLQDGEPLEFDQVADIVAQVADALEHAHRTGVVHRDVKPANIVVSPSGRAKLADFGIAHMASSSLTQTGSALGSPKYMSPEQVLGQPIDPRSDIFSLGVVLYELLVHRTPFERAGDSSVFPMLGRIASEPHEPVCAIDPAIPTVFDQVLARALAKDPAQRYEHAADMVSALRSDPALHVSAEHTMGIARPQKRPTPDVERTTIELIADVDAFAETFEARQLAQLRAEEAEQMRKEEELERWAQAEVERREEFERQREADASRQTAYRHAAAIERLRQQAARRAPPPDDSAQRAANAAKVDARLRVAFRYFSEFAAEMNRALPVPEKPYILMYLGEAPGAILGDGFTDYRSRELDGRERLDFVTFKFKARCPQPTSVEVSGRQLRATLDRLSDLHIPYKCTDYKKNDFGAVVRATLAMSGPFPCQITLRGDYDNPGFVLELINVRRYGSDELRFGLEELGDEVLDELGSYVLGVDDAFAHRMPARRS